MSQKHSCEVAMTKRHGDLTSGWWKDGEVRVCSCGQKWVHVCDEAEGCCWLPAADNAAVKQ